MQIKFILYIKKLKCLLSGISALPEIINYKNLTVHMLLNSTCNAKCRFCVVRKMKAEEISEDVLFNMAKPLYPKTNVLIPTWGEYTISKSGYKYLNWISQNYPHINLFTETNGIAFDEKWQNFSMNNLVYTACSLNAINAKRYQETVWEGEGGEVVYDKIINNLRNYQNLLKSNNLEVFGTRLSMVLTPDNYCDIEKFVRLSLELNSPFVTFFFDYTNYDIVNSTNQYKINDALKTLIEIEELLKGKYFIFYKLYTPFSKADIEKVKQNMEHLTPSQLQEKYSAIWELGKDRDYKAEFAKRAAIRKQHNKAFMSHLQECTVTGSQYILNNKHTNFCTAAWDHIFIYPNGDIGVCPWERWHNVFKYQRLNIRHFVKNNKINWNEVFNGVYYRLVRKNIKSNCYAGCMKNCPYKNSDFKTVYKDILE